MMTFDLTAPELQALTLAANGLSVPQIGARLFKGSETVKTQLGRARLKLGAQNTAHAVAIAVRAGVITPSDVELPAWLDVAAA